MEILASKIQDKTPQNIDIHPSVQLSVWCEIIRFTKPVPVADPLFTRNPRIGAHIDEGEAKHNKCENLEILLKMKVASCALLNARTWAKAPHL